MDDPIGSIIVFVLCVVFSGCMFFLGGKAGEESMLKKCRINAVENEVGEYYLDGEYNKKFRWLKDNPNKGER